MSAGIQGTIAGAVGGIVPLVFSYVVNFEPAIAAERFSGDVSVVQAVFWSGLALVGAGFLGSVVVNVLQERVIHKAIVLGITAPAFFSPYVDQLKSSKPNIRISEFSVISSAYAQDANAAKTNIFLQSLPDAECPGCTATIINKTGEAQEIITLDPQSPNFSGSKYQLPADSSAVVFDGFATTTQKIDVDTLATAASSAIAKTGETPDADASVSVTIGRDRSYYNDFLSAIGSQAAKPYNFDLTVTPDTSQL
ncbi:hypothetical protein [Hoeflea sp.]|uniref:hypothetical protein n=1 Tax=Hoeflea sp. TaxID=1940281 RepID=UPI003747B0FA